MSALRATLARSYSGALLDLDVPDWREIDLDDVARALSTMARFNGHTDRPLPVLEHSQVVAGLVPPRYRLAARLHDGHEYMTGDGTRPYVATLEKRLGRILSGLPAFGLLETDFIRRVIDGVKHDLDVAIARQIIERFAPGLPNADLEARQLACEMRSPIVKAADDAASVIELKRFFGGQVARSSEHYPEIQPAPEQVALDWLADVERETCERFGSGRRMTLREMQDAMASPRDEARGVLRGFCPRGADEGEA
jgi:hypothetical protein